MSVITSILDWEINRSEIATGTSRIRVGHTPLSPIKGSGSLQFYRNLQDWEANIVPGISIPKALSSGKLRSLFKIAYGVGVLRAGITFMQSQKDLSSNAGNFYFVYADSGDHRIIIAKIAGGLSATPTVLAQSSNNEWTNGAQFAMEVEWTASATQAVITVNKGVPEFENMAQLLTYTDTSSPYATTVAEGFGLASQTASLVTMTLDDTRIDDA